MEIYEVVFKKKLENELRKLPKHVVAKLLAWITAVKQHGLSQVKKTPGFHDEALKGNRKGQRSIRLSKSYRAIYISRGEIQLIEIIEVNKHDY